MKRLALISAFFLIPIFSMAQIDIDSTSLQAIAVTVYADGSDGEVYKSKTFPANHLFFFTQEKMTYEKEWKERDIRFTERPKENWLDIGKHLPHLAFLNARDHEGSKCSVFMIQDLEDDCYYVTVVYSDINFTFTCLPTDRKPWDNDPYTVDQMIRDQEKFPENPEYTDEEVDAFFKEFEEKTGISSKVARTFIMNEFIRDIQE